ncbi:MAG: NADH-quinone oxidoreductase subunit I [Spirochaetia bacterium]|nr:NADH-quinone oxidoreductase subunit I [Spirochaetia bacterium]
MATVKVHDKYKWKWYQKFYFISITSGMLVTLKYFLKCAILRQQATVQYPEEQRGYSSRFRGRHRLKRDEKGRERCTACFCCMWVCPAKCIHIEAALVPPEKANLYPEDKYAKVFNVDHLRCIFCGLCEEACPKGAIYLDGDIPKPFDNRDDFLSTKDTMLDKEGGPIIGTRL